MNFFDGYSLHYCKMIVPDQKLVPHLERGPEKFRTELKKNFFFCILFSMGTINYLYFFMELIYLQAF